MGLSPEIFRSQISEAKKRLARLMAQNQVINEEIADLRELIRANANFLPDGERQLELMCLHFFKSPGNITEAVRLAILLVSAVKLRATPIAVQTWAEYLGFDFSEYSNPMASIHSVLKRMKESDPPTVDYDEKTDEYWYGEVAISSVTDLLNPQAIVDAYGEAVTLLAENVKASEGMLEKMKDRAASSFVKKLEAIGKKKTRDNEEYGKVDFGKTR